MLNSTSRTFTTNTGMRVNVRAVQPQKPTGLASIGWTWPGYDVNVTVLEEKFERVGHLHMMKNGINFSWSLGTQRPFWEGRNTLNAYDLAKIGLTPHSYKTADFALNHLADYIKCSMEGTRFVP